MVIFGGRDYLRELTSHRDKQRNISDDAQLVLQDLQDVLEATWKLFETC